MKPLMLLGAVLTALGILALAFESGIHYTARETAPHETSSVKVSAPTEKIVSIPPVAGGLTLAAGVALMIAAARK